MNQYHTSEPWEDGGFTILAGDQVLFVSVDSTVNDTRIGDDEQQANVQRIVACVNAMKGIEDPERWMQEAKNIIDRIIDYSHPEMKLGDSKLEALFRHAKERDRLRESFGEFADMLMKIRRSNEAEGGVGNSLESRQITELLNKYIP